MANSGLQIPNRLTGLFAGLLLASMTAVAQPVPTAEATLNPRSDSKVAGSVRFMRSGEQVVVAVRAEGLTPGDHGFHIHESGDCSAPDASSAKGHFNPGGHSHGRFDAASHHLGDMPNLRANEAGAASAEFALAGVTLDGGPGGILGRSVVIHADADDYASQPAGNSGKRIACGTIVQTGTAPGGGK
jgi:Cu-Zn family superoxide dismutase